MKKLFFKLISSLLAACMLCCVLVACGDESSHVCQDKCGVCGKCTTTCTEPACSNKCKGNHATSEHVCVSCPECKKCLSDGCLDDDVCQGHDFAAELKLDLNSASAKIVNAEVRVLNGKQIGLIDGDTTHFTIKSSNKYYDAYFAEHDGILKSRYCAVNTPESTGTMEPWGQKASAFNKSKLKDAYSIVVESEADDDTWNKDSTGSRFMSWVWYKETADSDYRNLNLELLQEGLAIASSIGQTGRYSSICWRAYNYAQAKRQYVHGTAADPDFYYGDVIPITLKALRADLENYKNKTVALECDVAYVDGANVYIEDYDAETGLYLGFPVFTGYNFIGKDMMSAGNRIRLVGKVSSSDNYGWQIADLKYYAIYKPGKIGCKLLKTGVEQSYQLLTGTQFKGANNVQMTVVTGKDSDGNDVEEIRTFTLADLINGATISMENLTVTRTYTTTTGSSKGAITITCRSADGKTVTVRTDVLYHSDGTIVEESEFTGKTINVKGIVDFFNDDYQIAVHGFDFITIK